MLFNKFFKINLALYFSAFVFIYNKCVYLFSLNKTSDKDNGTKKKKIET